MGSEEGDIHRLVRCAVADGVDAGVGIDQENGVVDIAFATNQN